MGWDIMTKILKKRTVLALILAVAALFLSSCGSSPKEQNEIKGLVEYKTLAELAKAVGYTGEVKELNNPMYEVKSFLCDEEHNFGFLSGDWTIGAGGSITVSFGKGDRDDLSYRAEGEKIESYKTEKGTEVTIYKVKKFENHVSAEFMLNGFTFGVSLAGNDWDPSEAVKTPVLDLEAAFGK